MALSFWVSLSFVEPHKTPYLLTGGVGGAEQQLCVGCSVLLKTKLKVPHFKQPGFKDALDSARLDLALVSLSCKMGG